MRGPSPESSISSSHRDLDQRWLSLYHQQATVYGHPSLQRASEPPVPTDLLSLSSDHSSPSRPFLCLSSSSSLSSPLLVGLHVSMCASLWVLSVSVGRFKATWYGKINLRSLQGISYCLLLMLKNQPPLHHPDFDLPPPEGQRGRLSGITP